jgi:hypothetical protein
MSASTSAPGADGWTKPSDRMPETGAQIQIRVGDSAPPPGFSLGGELHRYVALYGYPERITWRPL